LQDLPKFTQIGIFGWKYTIWQPWQGQFRITFTLVALKSFAVKDEGLFFQSFRIFFWQNEYLKLI
jgi:hypothetical protein